MQMPKSRDAPLQDADREPGYTPLPLHGSAAPAPNPDFGGQPTGLQIVNPEATTGEVYATATTRHGFVYEYRVPIPKAEQVEPPKWIPIKRQRKKAKKKTAARQRKEATEKRRLDGWSNATDTNT